MAEEGGWIPRADVGEDEVHNAFLASVITIKFSQASKLCSRVQGKELRAVDESQVRGYWRELGP